MIGPPWSAADSIAPLDSATPGPGDAPTSSTGSWLVMFERPQPRPAGGAEQDPPSAAGPVAGRDAEPRLCDVLDAWRAADRQLAGLAESDPDWSRVHADVVGLRALHHRLFALRAEHRTADRELTSVGFAEIARAWLTTPSPQPVTA